MNQFLLNVFLAIIWTAFHRPYTAADFLIGFILAAILIALLNPLLGKSRFYGSRLLYVLQLLVVFIRELIKSAFQVLGHILRPKVKITPGIVKMNIELTTPEQITALANLITLTPGTLTIEIAKDESALYIHTLDLKDSQKLCQDIRDTLEAHIKKVTQ